MDTERITIMFPTLNRLYRAPDRIDQAFPTWS
jgi:hypothetical protein